MASTKDRTKITIQKRIRLDIEVYFLDIYSMAKYGEFYQAPKIKELVNSDIIELTKRHNITKIGDVRFILISSVVKNKKKIINHYVNIVG